MDWFTQESTATFKRLKTSESQRDNPNKLSAITRKRNHRGLNQESARIHYSGEPKHLHAYSVTHTVLLCHSLNSLPFGDHMDRVCGGHTEG